MFSDKYKGDPYGMILVPPRASFDDLLALKGDKEIGDKINKIINRLGWIKKQQLDFAQQPRQSVREMFSGERHYVWGRPYRLDVVEAPGMHRVELKKDRLCLQVQPGTRLENKTRTLEAFYRESLKERVHMLLPHWLDQMGVSVAAWGVKKMKTKWGSCNIQAGRIWLNLELAKKPPECLEYILYTN